MTPDEALTRWEVSVMITNAITDYDRKQEVRHNENTKKLDRLMYLIVGTLLTVLGGIFVEVVMHGR